VFDAGSSGTRMYVYKWQTGFSAAKGDELVLMEDNSCITDDNGIDKINNKDDLVTKFKKCISKAEERVPKERKSRTYIFLAATAGMRLLQ
jgi:golgi apyrase